MNIKSMNPLKSEKEEAEDWFCRASTECSNSPHIVGEPKNKMCNRHLINHFRHLIQSNNRKSERIKNLECRLTALGADIHL